MPAEHATFQFGRFTLDPQRRALLAGGDPIAISSRAFDILHTLIEGRDRVLTKDEIITRVWHGLAVEENNLAVHVSALRRVLADPAAPTPIATIPGRGYRFVGQVVEQQEPAPQPVLAVPPDPPEPRPGAPAARPSRVLAGLFAMLIICGAAALAWRAHVAGAARRTPDAPRLSLAVLPFRNLGADRGQDSLADAISDDLTTDLSHIPGSTVIARASSDTYKGRAVAADEIGRALHVRYLLEGSLRGEDGVFRINAQLIDAATGAHLWAERFDVSQAKVSDAQTDIVRHIASALNATLFTIEDGRALQDEDARARRDRPNDPDALALFFRARSMLSRDWTLAGLTNAQRLLERAASLQPDFAEALTELGWVLLSKVSTFDDPDDAADHARAQAVVARALALPPRRADTLATQGFLNTIDGRNEDAIAGYGAALAIDRNNVRAKAGLAYCQWRLGHPEATASLLAEAVRLDPVGPTAKSRFQLLGMALFVTGQYGPAIDWLHRALAGDPDPAPGADGLGRVEFSHLYLIAALVRTGGLDDARQAYAAYRSVWPRRTVWRLMAYATPAQAALPGFRILADALVEAGMPRFADEHALEQLQEGQAPDKVEDGSDFAISPARIAGAQTIEAEQLGRLLKQNPQPRIIDVGCGAVAMPATRRPRPGQDWEEMVDAAIAADRRQDLLAGSSYVIMGTGAYGRQSMLAARRFIAAGAGQVLWFRGGEEAWAAAHSNLHRD